MSKEIRPSHGGCYKPLLIRTSLLGLGLVLFPGLSNAGGFGNDNQGCAVDAPCFQSAYQSGTSVIFEFNGVTGWDLYNVRYAKVGGAEEQRENRSGHFTFTNVGRHRVYTLKVQGCHTHLLGRSDCSAWVEASVTTN